MFKKEKKTKAARISTIVGEGTEIHGDVMFSGGLHIDGIIRGNVTADSQTLSVLTVREKGMIEGEVKVPNIVLNGRVSGDVYASERIELAPRAVVTGNVYYNLLEMSMGASVNGNLVHNVETQQTVVAIEAEDPEESPERIKLD